MKRWLGDRPAFVALAALLAPVLISIVGLGFTSLMPDVQAASRVLPQFSLHLPGFPSQDVAPLAPVRPDHVVPPGRTEIRVPILMYHYIRISTDSRDRLGFNLSVTPADFLAQMDWLKASDYHPVDLGDLHDYFQARKPLPARPVVLTFDDGYADFYTAALPVLMSHEFKAVAYVVPGFLNRANYMTTDQLEVVDQSGIEIAAHTMHHVDLTRASAAGLALEIQGSRNALEQIVGHPVLDFCYPSGQFNDVVVAATRQAGFLSATTEIPGTGHAWSNRLTWSRTRVSGGERLDQFIASLGQPEPTVAASPATGA